MSKPVKRVKNKIRSHKHGSRTEKSRTKSRVLRLHGAIARDIGIKIASGKYKPGSLLNGEILASGRLKVSRTAYREAVRILAAKGLVESRPKVGTRVNPKEKWHLLDPDVLAWIFEFEPDETLLENVFELRKIIEPNVAALAAVRASKQDLSKMSVALEGMALHGLAVEDGRLADQDFHAALLRASGNAFLASLTSSISAAITWITIFRIRRQALLRDGVPDHRRVYEAVASGNPKLAYKTMKALIEHALEDAKNTGGTKKIIAI